MKYYLALVSALLVIGLASCSKGGPPKALPLGEAPAVLQASFKKANPEVAKSARAAVSCLASNDLPGALAHVKALCADPALTASQREAASRVMLALNEKIQQEAAQGDAAANQVLQLQRNQK